MHTPTRHASTLQAPCSEVNRMKHHVLAVAAATVVLIVSALSGTSWAAVPPSSSFVAGQPAITTALACVGAPGSVTTNTSSFVSVSRPAPNTPPRVGDVFYASVIVSLLDGGCGPIQFGLQINRPAGVNAVNNANDAPACFLLDANNQRRSITCPTNGANLPANLPGGGQSLNFEFVQPLQATQAINTPLSASVRIIQQGAGMDVNVNPNVQLVVNPAAQPANPTITYPNPSTTAITNTSATLNGTVNNQGIAGNAFFDFGTTTAYGTSSNAIAIPATGNAFNVSIPFNNLTPGTNFNWRVRFVPGNGGATINGANQTFTTTGAPQPTNRSLSVTRNGNGSGTVTSNPAGINCGNTCTANFANNSSVTLTATPANGSTFTGWSGACSGTGTCTVTMNADRAVTATFSQQAPQSFRLTVTRQGTGRVVDLGGIINCRDGNINVVCSSSFAAGSTVKLRAIPDSGASFADWDGACDDPNPDCDVVMNSDKTVTAKFVTIISNTRADLVLSATGQESPVTGLLEHVYSIRNAGPDAAQNVRLNITAGNGAFSSSDPSGCTANGTQISCNLGTLNNNGILTVRIRLSGPFNANPVTSTAQVTSTTNDLDQGNNTATASVTLSGGNPPVIPPTPAGSTLIVRAGANNVAQISAQKGQQGVSALHARLEVTQSENTRLSAVRLEASGNGQDALDITAVRLVHDANGNGQADAGEAVLGSGRFPGNDASLNLALGTSLVVPVGQAQSLLVTLDFNDTLAARALVPTLSVSVLALLMALRRRPRWSIGVLLASSVWLAGCQTTQTPPQPTLETRTYQVRIASVTATGLTSGSAVNVTGLPVSGGVISLQK